MTSTKLPNSGERMVPAYHRGQLFYGEHIIRYRSTQGLVKDKVVLDIASGTGYGTHMLAKSAKHVFGVDTDEGAVSYAKKNYAGRNIEYVVGDAIKIPLSESMVDIVVSFETIEHIKQYKKFLEEIKRVLKPSGLLIMSTPNNKEYPETNPFHVHEFSYDELKKLLRTFFVHQKDYFQATWLYSAILDNKRLSYEWEEPVLTVQTQPLSIDKSVYFLSIYSDKKIDKTIRPIGALSQYSSAREDEQKRLELERLAADVKQLRHAFEQKSAENRTLINQLQQIKNSRTWRLRSKLVKLIGRK